jgi:GTP cyclohydrolase I
MVITLTNQDVMQLCIQMRNRIEALGNKNPSIYGVPRGGIPVAYLLAGTMNSAAIVDNLSDATIVVDDIIASGKTRDRFPDHHFFALIEQPVEGNWYVFPWEGTLAGSAEDIPLRMLQAIGENPARDGLRDTPSRVVRSWKELYKGYGEDPTTILGRTFENTEGYNEMVVLRDIEMYSTCEHHLLPFFGKVHIAYIPTDRVVGISKLARLVECFSRRVQIQERLTQQIADTLEKVLNPLGVAVMIEAQHLCMLARGVAKQNSVMVTSALRGNLIKQEARLEFLLLKGNH